MNKANGGVGTPAELFRILKDDAVKVLHSICQQIWKTQQWPEDGKRSVFIPIPKPHAGQESTVRTRHEIRNLFKIGKGVCQSYILSLCLFRAG